MIESNPALSHDLSYIKEVLSQFGAYRFPEDVQRRMDRLDLSSSALARRCLVSHTIVDNWRRGKARPNGKERMKELGMALAMDTDSLNAFLLYNGYPRLYVKNPLDSAARLLLLSKAGQPDIVPLYRELTKRLGLEKAATVDEEAPLATVVMSMELKQAAAEGTASQWFRLYRGQFTGDGKTQMPSFRMIRFLLLYLGESSIRELEVAGELPAALGRLLYPILAGKAVTVRFLREKLIAFGLYSNMTEEEIDVMLRCMGLQPLTEPASALDLAVLSALRCAHERYPFFEYENLCRIVRRLTPPGSQDDANLLEQYAQRAETAGRLTAYYEAHEPTEEEQRFEARYTSFADRGVMDYVRDLLLALTDAGSLSAEESGPMIDLLERNQEGTSLWN